MADTDELGDRHPQKNRDDGRAGREDRHCPGPLLERVQQLLAFAKMTEHCLPSGCDLQRLPEHGQDQQVTDKRRERAVVLQQAGEDDR